MSYTPTADGAALAAAIAAKLSAAGQPAMASSLAGGNTAPGGMADAILEACGLVGQSDAFALGAATRSANTFADVGNGSSTGFATWTVNVPIAKSYLLHVDLSAFMTVAADQIFFQVEVDGATTGVTNLAGAMQRYFGALSARERMSWRQPIAFAAAGNHTIKLQWKTTGVGTANVDASDFRTFTLSG